MIKKWKKRLLLCIFILSSLWMTDVLAANSYYINGVYVSYTDFTSSPNDCWNYANNIYNKIWGHNFNNRFDDSENSLRNLSDSELSLTPQHLKTYVTNAALGSVLRICDSQYLHIASDGWGHSQIIVQKDNNGFTVIQGGLSAAPYCNERYYTWDGYCDSWSYEYIKYIKWPGANAYSASPVSFDSLSVTDITNGNAAISGWVSNTGIISEIGFYIGSSDSYQNKVPMTQVDVQWTRFELDYNIVECYGELNPGTTYTWLFYVISDGVEYHSSVGHFTTSGTKNISYDTYQVLNVTGENAQVSGWYSNTNAYNLSSIGFYVGDNFSNMEKYEVHTNKTWTRHNQVYQLQDYMSLVKPKTNYYVRFYVTLNNVNYYSDYLYLTTGESSDTTAPVISDIAISEMSETGYTVTCKVTDNVGITHVKFSAGPYINGTWNVKWLDGTISGDTVTCRVSASDFENGMNCLYATHIYAYDMGGNETRAEAPWARVNEILTPVKTIDYNGMSYYLYEEDEYHWTWSGAESYCEAMGGHLVSITSQEEQEIVNKLVEGSSAHGFWIGGSDRVEEATWMWSSGESITYSNWSETQPDNWEEEDYMLLQSTKEWNDVDDSSAIDNDISIGFIFEKTANIDEEAPKVTNPRVTEVTVEGFTVVCDIYDNVEVTGVEFIVGEESETYQATIDGDTASCFIPFRNHGYKVNCDYAFTTYAYDAADNSTFEYFDDLYVELEMETYTITYHLDGGTLASGSIKEYPEVHADIQLFDPTKENCIFDGWYTAKTGGEKVTIISSSTVGNLNLYARWIENDPIITDGGIVSVGTITGSPGETIQVPITMEKNPGIIAAQFKLKYDDTKLKLVKVTDGGILDTPVFDETYIKNPYVLSWGDGILTTDITQTGIIATISFEIIESCEEGLTEIELVFDSAYNAELDDVLFTTVNGTIEVKDCIPGDVNNDGEVKLNDALLLRRYVAGWDVDVNLEAADVNGDGEVKLNDALLLRRYVAGWDVTIQ